jgi:hypothetical protein
VVGARVHSNCVTGLLSSARSGNDGRIDDGTFRLWQLGH